MTARPDEHEENAKARELLEGDYDYESELEGAIAAALRQAAAEERGRIVTWLRSEPRQADSLHGIVVAGRLADAIARLAHHAAPAAEPTNTIAPLPPHVEAAVVEMERRMAAESQPKSEIRAVATHDEWGKPSVSATPVEYVSGDTRIPMVDGAQSDEAWACGECGGTGERVVASFAAGSEWSRCPACNGTGKARDGAGERPLVTRTVGEPSK